MTKNENTYETAELRNAPGTEKTVRAVFAAAEMEACCGKRVSVLQGGNAGWSKAGHLLEKGETHLASPARDRYKRPYEGTNIGPEAMQAYLDWEFGLVAQLGKDGTHHFWVL